MHGLAWGVWMNLLCALTHETSVVRETLSCLRIGIWRDTLLPLYSSFILDIR